MYFPRKLRHKNWPWEPPKLNRKQNYSTKCDPVGQGYIDIAQATKRILSFWIYFQNASTNQDATQTLWSTASLKKKILARKQDNKKKTHLFIWQCLVHWNTVCAFFLMFVCLCVVSIIRNWWPTRCNFLVYLFVPKQLYMFRAMFSPIVRSTWLHLQLLIQSTYVAAGRCYGRDGTGVPFRPWYRPAAT